MSDQSNKPINPFLSAQRRSGVHVSLEVGDVLALKPEWTEQQAKTFMDRHAAVIAHAMLTAGTFVMGEFLEGP